MSQHDGEVQILMIHPDSIGAQQRADELDQVVDVEAGIKKTLFRLYEMQEKLSKRYPYDKDRLTIKLYNVPPSISMHQWDNDAYVSFYSATDRVDNAPHLKISLKTTFGHYVTHKFEELWNHQDSILLNEHMQLTIWLDDQEKRYTYGVRIADIKPISFYASCNFGDRFGDFMKQRCVDQQPIEAMIDGQSRKIKCRQVIEPAEKQIAIEQLKAKYGWDDEGVDREIGSDPIVYLLESLGYTNSRSKYITASRKS
jgi:hypothetical protein